METEEPDLSATGSTLPGTKPLGNPNSTAVRNTKQDEVKVGWDQPSVPDIKGECKYLIFKLAALVHENCE